MNQHQRLAFLTVVLTLGIATGLAFALSGGSAKVGELPVVVLCAAAAFVINWLAFIPSYLYRTEHYFDLVGSLTHLTLIVVALVGSSDLDLRSIIVSVIVGVWAVRLGSFLFLRAQKSGGDGRFDTIKHHPGTFFSWWSIQALWVLVTGSCSLVIITSAERETFGWVAVLGLALWAAGFLIEVLADRQKTQFRSVPKNSNTFIRSGLWAWSRHPNYFGEIVLWIGVAVLAIPLLSGWKFIALISPIFVFVLLTRISGIPILERRSIQRWGDDVAYQEYLRRTPILLMRKPNAKIKDL